MKVTFVIEFYGIQKALNSVTGFLKIYLNSYRMSLWFKFKELLVCKKKSCGFTNAHVIFLVNFTKFREFLVRSKHFSKIYMKPVGQVLWNFSLGQH